MDNPLICLCYDVRKNQILEAIRNKGLTTLEEIQAETQAGTACGCCIEDIELIIEEELRKKIY